MTERLPVDEVLDELHDALLDHQIVILEAPPGAGKTTRVPPSLINLDIIAGKKVIMLEPRRVAARAAARRMADELGEDIGDTIGLRTKFDTRTGRKTRVEVITEGILTRMLVDDPSLDGVGVVVFDEFHERSIHADTALVFALESIDALRPDLRLIIMSATLETTALADHLRTDAVIRAQGRSYPVTTIYRPPRPQRSADDEVPDAVIDALAAHTGDVLVFLAGTRDIANAQRNLAKRVGPEIRVLPLHGMLTPDQQDAALRPDRDGRRKVILSTPIAETSVTIDGVGVVIDTGRRRRPEMDHGRGMSRLRTVNAGRAATDQRRGRAGRQGPGVCVRLWSEADQQRRRPHDPPEMATDDLTSLALQLAAWGVSDHLELRWIDPPPEAAMAAARGTLATLGAIDDARRITAHGTKMLRLGAEPRLAHLMIVGSEAGLGATACDLAAVLSDRDILRGRDRPADLRIRIEALHGDGPNVDRAARARARETARRWRRSLGVGDDPIDIDVVGALVSQAFPNRMAKRRQEPGVFLLASGAGARLPDGDGLARESLLAVAELQGSDRDARIRTAAPIDLDDIEAFHRDRLEHTVVGGWDRRRRDVVFEDQRKLGALVLSRSPTTNPPADAVLDALLTGVRREGLGILSWTKTDDRFRSRLAFMNHLDPENWPDVTDEALLGDLDNWLVPSLKRTTRRSDLANIDVKEALGSLIDWRQRRDLDKLAPTHLTVPSGSIIPIDYSDPEAPTLAVRLQEVFGLTESPRIGDGKVTVVLHLLSPAHRLVQATTDLESFWSTGYGEVRKELRGRYPKHHWPEDPTTATATAKAKRRG